MTTSILVLIILITSRNQGSIATYHLAGSVEDVLLDCVPYGVDALSFDDDKRADDLLLSTGISRLDVGGQQSTPDP